MSAKKKCCCGGTCANGTGCASAKTLCTGYRFVLPHLDSVSISGDQSRNTETDGTEPPNEHFYNDGINRFRDPVLPRLLYEYDISVAAVDHSAFKSTLSPATYYGYKVTVNVGGDTMTFDATDGTGVTFSSNISTIPMSTGTWDVGPWVTTGSTSTTTESIESYSFSHSSGPAVLEYEAIYFAITRDFSGGQFSYSLNYVIERGRINTNPFQHVYLYKRYVNSSSPSFTTTLHKEYSRAGTAGANVKLIVHGKASGSSTTATTPCLGTPATFATPSTYHRAQTGNLANTTVLVPPSTFGWTLPDLNGTILPPGSLYLTGTAATGTATMANDTGTWTDEEVHCRDCPRYLSINGTIELDYAQTGYEGTKVTATISGRLVQPGVSSCSPMYLCVWNSISSADNIVTFSDSTTAAAGVDLARLGPSLWRLTISTTWGVTSRVYTFLLKFAGECPIGSPEVCPVYIPATINTVGPTTVQAIHTYGERAVANGDGTVTVYDDVDVWGTGTNYLDHTATTADVATFEVDTDDGYTSRVLQSSFTFAEVDREEGDHDYYCNGWTAFDTGQEVDGDSKDLHYRKKIGSGSYFAPTVETTNPFLTYYFNGDGTGAGKWIGTDADGTGEVDDHAYETHINWDGEPESDIHCFISADNYVTALEINGVVVQTNLTPNDTTSHEQEFEVILYATDMVEGSNTIRWIHEDQGEREGFRCRFVRP